MKTDISDLEDRLRNIIIGTCNTIGCDNCGLKWIENGKEECSATELQGKILDEQFPQYKKV